ncbi:cation diffusion facilitator family transporter [Otariodibacter sp.]|uniref:cation diffusion facilitator family transporter n=1 Tax=Otariodibacter sp. TaxID=3030919 RepID=UPI00262FA25A|nr:cation diffusion facilitator family transporter [Otariodibacter sp.]
MQHITFEHHHAHHYKIQTESKKTLWISLVLTLLFALIELIGGLLSGSLALISDSFHMFSDALALVLSMIAIYYVAKKSDKRFTYGYARLEIIAAFLNGLALIIIALGILYEGIIRLVNPIAIDFNLMMTVAIIGLVINIILTFILMRSLKAENNLNIKSALWHFIGDLLNSVGVIIAAILIKLTGISEIDALVSLIVGVVIFLGGYKICKAAFYILMEAVPKGLKTDEVYKTILSIEGVSDIHEFHLWSISDDLYSLSFHVILTRYDSFNDYKIVQNLTNILKEKHGINHVTIQIENPKINNHFEV